MRFPLPIAIMLAIFLVAPLGGCSTAPAAGPNRPFISATDLVPEDRLPRSEGGDVPREELAEDASRAREAHEALRLKWNRIVGEVKAWAEKQKPGN